MYSEIINNIIDDTKINKQKNSKLKNNYIVEPNVTTNNTIKSIADNIINNPPVENNNIEINNAEINNTEVSPFLFTLQNFILDIENKNKQKNKEYLTNVKNISAYDISSNCIRETLFKLMGCPVEDYKDIWLPIMMRSFLGNAIHDFIQSICTCFTESEISLRVPSKRLSVRIDNLINNNVLVEIKSCPYTDYSKIINSKKPRISDFKQVLLYRWMLHNCLDEIRSQPRNTLRTNFPKLENYNIKYIQFIYVAHDLISSDIDSISEAIKFVSKVKKTLDSKKNKFFFITPLTLDLNQIDVTEFENEIIEHVNLINYCLDNNIIPNKSNKFVKPDHCFFCLYSKVCSTV